MDSIETIKSAIHANANMENELHLESQLRLSRRKSHAPSHVINGKLMGGDNVYETYIVLEYEDTPLEILWETSLSKKPVIFKTASSTLDTEEFDVELGGTYHIVLYLDNIHGREVPAIKTITKGTKVLYTETTELTIEARIKIRTELDHSSQLMDDEGFEFDLHLTHLLIPFEGGQIKILWEAGTSGAVNFFGYEPDHYPMALSFEFEPEEVFTFVIERTTKATATKYVIKKIFVREDILFECEN